MVPIRRRGAQKSTDREVELEPACLRLVLGRVSPEGHQAIAGWPGSDLLPPPMRIRWRGRDGRWSCQKAAYGWRESLFQGRRGDLQRVARAEVKSNGSSSDLWCT